MLPVVPSTEAVPGGPEVRRARQSQFDTVLSNLTRETHGGAARWAFFVPGRVEVLGKHTDYAGGRSLLCAVEQGIALSATARSDSEIRIVNADTGESVACDIGREVAPPAGHWGNYPLTVVRRLARNFPTLARGATLVFTSNLPSAAGLSSSSALMIAVYLGLAAVNRLTETRPFKDAINTPEDLAAYLATIENGMSFRGLVGDAGVGTFGGSEDHTAILCCREGELAQYRFGPVSLERRVPFDGALVFVVGDSGVEAQKTGAARERYNRASRLAARVLELWRGASGVETSTLASALGRGGETRRRMRDVLQHAGDDEFPVEDLLGRFDQFCLENFEIVPAATAALAEGDLGRFGALVERSQGAAERWLKNQVPETAALVRLARQHGATAASAFGAGFGGSVWALVPRTDDARFTSAWREAYRVAFPARAARARFFSTRPGAAAYGVHVGG